MSNSEGIELLLAKVAALAAMALLGWLLVLAVMDSLPAVRRDYLELRRTVKSHGTWFRFGRWTTCAMAALHVIVVLIWALGESDGPSQMKLPLAGVLSLIAGSLLAWPAASVAKVQGRNHWPWFLLGLCFPFIGGAAALLILDRGRRLQEDAAGRSAPVHQDTARRDIQAAPIPSLRDRRRSITSADYAAVGWHWIAVSVVVGTTLVALCGALVGFLLGILWILIIPSGDLVWMAGLLSGAITGAIVGAVIPPSLLAIVVRDHLAWWRGVFRFDIGWCWIQLLGMFTLEIVMESSHSEWRTPPIVFLVTRALLLSTVVATIADVRLLRGKRSGVKWARLSLAIAIAPLVCRMQILWSGSYAGVRNSTILEKAIVTAIFVIAFTSYNVCYVAALRRTGRAERPSTGDEPPIALASE